MNVVWSTIKETKIDIRPLVPIINQFLQSLKSTVIFALPPENLTLTRLVGSGLPAVRQLYKILVGTAIFGSPTKRNFVRTNKIDYCTLEIILTRVGTITQLFSHLCDLPWQLLVGKRNNMSGCERLMWQTDRTCLSRYYTLHLLRSVFEAYRELVSQFLEYPVLFLFQCLNTYSIIPFSWIQ